MICTELACGSYSAPFCAQFADGKTCTSALDAGCDPTTHAGRLNYDDPMIFYELLNVSCAENSILRRKIALKWT